MKTKLPILITVLSIVFSLARVSGQQINPQTGLPQTAPINPQTGLPEEVPNIDSTTGLPADGRPPFKDTNGAATWIDPSWKDPDTVLPSISWNDFPLVHVDTLLRKQFTNDFDIILPNSPQYDLTDYGVHLELKNVKASEIFNAMNLEFELDAAPLRWELTSNGSRPTALLRYLPQLVPPAPPQIRKVFYVGDLLGEKSGQGQMQKVQDLSDMIVNTWLRTGLPGGTVNTYPQGQLLIISGTADQVDLAEQTLSALKEKADFENAHPVAQPKNP